MKLKFSHLFLVLFTFQFAFAQNKLEIIEKYELFFNNNIAELNAENTSSVKKYFIPDEKYKISTIKIDAHCDSKASLHYNQILSEKRAEAVLNEIPENLRFLVESYSHGKTKPKYLNQEEYKNRRVDIEIHKTEIPIIEKKSEIAIIKTIEKKLPKEEKAEKNATERAETLLRAEVGETISFEDIQFHPGTPTPLSSSISIMEALADLLLQYGNLEIEIQGHICCVSVDDSDISTKRALTVYNFLIESGIDKSRLKYKGYGRSRPKTQERTEEEKQMNRRVEIKILKK